MKNITTIFKRVLDGFGEHKCVTWAAAIAYYTLLSFFPLILGVVAIGSVIISDPATRQNIVNAMVDSFPKAKEAGVDINEIVNGFITSISQAAPLLATFSILATLWSGSNIIDQIIQAVNVAWGVRKDGRSFLTKVLLRFMLLGLLGVLLLASFGVTIVIQLIKGLDWELFGLTTRTLGFVYDLAAYFIPLLLIFSIFMLIYWLAPYRVIEGKKHKVQWGALALGALLGALLFEGAQYGITVWFTQFGGDNGYARTYGAIAGLIIFLFFIYVDAVILLLCAELAAILSQQANEKAAVKHAAAKSELKVKPIEIYPHLEEIETPDLALAGKTKSSPLALILGLVTLGIMSVLGILRVKKKNIS